MLAYAHVCGPVSMRYRSSETNFQYRYRRRYIYMYGCWLTASKFFFFFFLNIHFYWCNFLIHVVSILIVRSV